MQSDNLSAAETARVFEIARYALARWADWYDYANGGVDQQIEDLTAELKLIEMGEA